MVLEFRVLGILGILGILGFRVWGISRIWVQGSSDSRYPALVLLSGDMLQSESSCEQSDERCGVYRGQ